MDSGWDIRASQVITVCQDTADSMDKETGLTLL